ncbi:hypothetical protein F0562_033824 [Nyssa sinensis]|uniref:Uncharacterized protein n=1 Tax=Nyssa sinensis TaxID=561372 RepID=A0A5J5AIT2_9ASTE|nr:hypothetical protein F0562_033824 [Nyssa sinensis]
MGTKVHYKSYSPGYYSMRDLNEEDSNGSRWPLFYGDKTLTNGQYYNVFFPRTLSDSFPGYDKDALKQKMLEHDAIFKNQVKELHRLYRIQRDMMDEIKRMELHKHRMPIETSSSSTLLASQMPSEDARKWHIASFPLANSVSARSSMSGAEIINSPLSCTIGNNTQAGPSPPQNGYSSKDCEILESRPSKVRKKLFDLQLPADEYIDTEDGEQYQDNKMSDTSSYLPNRNHKIASESNVKLFLGGGVKTDQQGDASRSDSCMRSSVGLADLNEPIQVEEATVPASVDFLGRGACNGESKGLDLSAKPKSQFLGLPKEILQNSLRGSNNESLNKICVENKGKGREWLSRMNEAGHSESNLNFIPQGYQPDKLPLPSQPMHIMPNKAHQPSGVLPTDHNKGDLWREGTGHGLEISERGRDLTSFNHLEPVVASHIRSPYPFINTNDMANAWSHSIASWEKPNSSLTQKLAPVQTHPSLSSSATLSSSQPSVQGHEIFGNKWLLNSSSRTTTGFGGDLPNRNGSYHGSSSGSKDLPIRFPSVGFDYLNCNKDDNVASERSINYGSGSFFKCSNVIDLNSAKDINLNVVLSKSSSNEVVPRQGVEIIDGERKHEDRIVVLPWLKAKPTCKNEDANMRRDSNSVELSFYQASSNQLSNKGETANGPNQIFSQNIAFTSCDHDVGAKRKSFCIEIGDSLGDRKILGFPIFENPSASKNESSSLVSTSASLRCPPQGEDIKTEGKTGLIDINVACDLTVPESGKHIAAEVQVVEKETDITVTSLRNHIDLNSCISEDEVPLVPSAASTSANVKFTIEIDLEAPVIPEVEEEFLPGEVQYQHETVLKSPQCKANHPPDEVIRIAAEAIVAISSFGHNNMEDSTWTCHPSEASLADSLLWFVEVVSSCTDDLESKLGIESSVKVGGENDESSCVEFDYFEAMTLKLTEIKEEEYMPKPLVPENLKVEETGATSVPNRSRKGQARRGRQRRDFQRDILPGLASLSRHEVTEDLQTFGGLMRATGHFWHSGSTRRNGTRNGGARGRRRLLIDPTPAPTPTPTPTPTPAVAVSTICTPLMQQLNNIEVGLEDRSLTGWGKTTRRPRRQRCPAGNPPPVPLT